MTCSHALAWRHVLATVAACIATNLPTTGQAQRADANVVTSAEDAFGFAVSGQSLGIYNARSVRGFDPVQLGNVRLNGLYFDRLSGFTSQLIESTFIRVGSTAVNYPFPAPSGIADYRVHGAQQENSTAITVGLNPQVSPYFEADLGRVVIDDRLSVFGGIGVNPNERTAGKGDMDSYSGALSLTARPSSDVEVTLFWNRIWDRKLYSDPVVYVTDRIVPAVRITGDGVGQSWAAGSGYGDNTGVMSQWGLGSGWSARAGAFRSQRAIESGFDQYFVVDTDPEHAVGYVYGYRDRTSRSYSGEAALTREWGTSIAQRLDFSIRGRDLTNHAGRDAIGTLGRTSIYHTGSRATAALQFGDAMDRTYIDQWIAGVRYRSDIHRRLTISTALQRSFYDINFQSRDGSKSSEAHEDTLFNIAIAMPLLSQLALYSSFSQGLEEGGVAPADTLNRYQILPVIEAKQIDLGMHYSSPTWSVVAGVFELEKPYAGSDTSSIYRLIGDVKNRGAEVSITARPVERLTIVAGAVFLDAQVVDRSRAQQLGQRPLGVPKRSVRLDMDYALPNFFDVSLDFSGTYTSNVRVSDDYPVFLGKVTSFNVGARIPWTLMGMPSAMRVQVQNVTDELAWAADTDGALIYQAPRTFSIAFTVAAK